MDFYKLEYFISAARHLSFTKAAEECHVTQTVISRQISSLEEELGCTLFYRNNRKVELTPAGVYFYDESIYLLQYYRAAVKRLEKIDMGYKGTLKIGMGPYEPALLRPCLTRFQEIHPEISITCMQFSYGILPFRFNRGFVDVAFATSSCAEAFSPVQLQTAAPADWVVAASISHPYWQLPPERQSRLDGQNLIVLEDDFNEDYRIQCAQRGFTIRSFTETNFLASQMLMVEAGVGVAMLPGFLEFSSLVRTRPLPAFDFVPEFVSAVSPENHNPCVQPFLDLYYELSTRRPEPSHIL